MLFQKQPPPLKCPLWASAYCMPSCSSLAYLFCAILFIYRINRMHCKAIIRLLCNETTLHLRVSCHWAWVRCTWAAWLRCWCDGLALHSHVHPYSFQGLPNLRDHLAQVGLCSETPESHVCGCPMEAEPGELKMSLWSRRMSKCVAQGVMGSESLLAISHPCLPSGTICSIKHYFKSLGPVTSSKVKIS